jgi:hypothetical protein
LARAFPPSDVKEKGKELRQMLNQFFDRAVYYEILGYDEGGRKADPRAIWQESKTWPYQLALMSKRKTTPNALKA